MSKIQQNEHTPVFRLTWIGSLMFFVRALTITYTFVQLGDRNLSRETRKKVMGVSPKFPQYAGITRIIKNEKVEITSCGKYFEVFWYHPILPQMSKFRWSRKNFRHRPKQN